jgi:methanogenic corrinoid protein MtbC1
MAEYNRDAVAERNPATTPGQRDDKGRAASADLQAQERYDADQDAAAEHLSQLVRTIETEIIPRLMLAHRADADARLVACGTPAAGLAPDVGEFTVLLLAPDSAGCENYVRSLCDAGYALDEIYLNLMAPAARRLGVMWEEDTCSFSEVTVGLSRLHRRVLELGPAFHSGRGTFQPGKRALLVAAPGEQHTFGLFLVTEFFRREGWEVWGEPIRTVPDLAEAVRGNWFELVGLSAGSAQRLEDVRSAVSAVRKASLNGSVAVMVGGPLFLLNPGFADAVGADGVGMDAQDALAQAERLIRLEGIRPST